MPFPKPDKPWKIIEYFSGRGRLSRLAAKAGFAAAAFDINNGYVNPNEQKRRKTKRPFAKRKPMDINGEIGFVWLSWCLVFQGFVQQKH